MAILRGGKSSSASSSSPCAHLRTAYHNCFNRWYSEKFLKGQWDKEECVSEWQKYQSCLSQHLEDKNLSSFLEGKGAADSSNQADSGSPVGGASTEKSTNFSEKLVGGLGTCWLLVWTSCLLIPEPQYPSTRPSRSWVRLHLDLVSQR